MAAGRNDGLGKTVTDVIIWPAGRNDGLGKKCDLVVQVIGLQFGEREDPGSIPGAAPALRTVGPTCPPGAG